ncbi:MAG TPA: hypothetical protein VHR45_08120 [Thermoanaerobaculia bacterium]|nr:hypothetical protein [Thermoanaerobaculia bacterium]
MAMGGQSSGGLLTATSADGKRSVQIMLSSSDKGTQAAITFTEKP